jgi:hypothetical protein
MRQQSESAKSTDQRVQMRQEVDRLKEESNRALDDAYAALKAELSPERWEELARAVQPWVTR